MTERKYPLADSLALLYGRVPLGMRLGLDAMRAACQRFGHPEQAFAAVHVAGTNGKGSVSAMVEAVARAAGLRTGLYTSPHLCRFAERIRIDGEPIADDELACGLRQILADEANLSFFEAATLTAFLEFRAARVDVAIIEVGLGGRLDATNVLPSPRAAAITRIALDHTARLGATLVEIAREKAGIAKPGLDIVLGPMQNDVRRAIDEVAHAHGATTTSVDEVVSPPFAEVGLAGEHQRTNARIAAVLGERLGISQGAIASGLAGVRWPSRLERIGPYLLDAAHNPDGAASLSRYVEGLGVSPSRTTLIFGALVDKDWEPMLALLAPLASSRIYLEAAGGSRSGVDPRQMVAAWAGTIANAAPDALALARGDLIVIAGSMTLVGALRGLLLGLPCDPPVAL